jgi:hypothetical protein
VLPERRTTATAADRSQRPLDPAQDNLLRCTHDLHPSPRGSGCRYLGARTITI